MNYLLEQKVKINRDTAFKNLYAWCLNEHDEDKNQIGGDWVPSEWIFWFTGASLQVSTKLNIKRDFESNISSSNISKVIHGKFHSGICLDGEKIIDNVNFSIFGTSRFIKEFNVTISETENEKEELCLFTVIPSYESEDEEFRKEIEEDYAGFDIFIHPEKLSELSKLIENGSIEVVRFSVRNVEGVYAGWTPTGKVYSAKLLASDDVIENISEIQFEGTNIGRVQDFSITFATHAISKKK